MSSSFTDNFPKDSAQAKTVQLVAIGQGKPKFAREFAEAFRFVGQMYVDPSKSLFTRLKFTLRAGRNGVCCSSCKTCCSLTSYFAWGILCRCWCPCYTGDVLQNGGVIIVDQSGKLIFKHVEREVNDHPDPDGIMAIIPK